MYKDTVANICKLSIPIVRQEIESAGSVWAGYPGIFITEDTCPQHGSRKLIPNSCLLTSTCTLIYVPSFMYSSLYTIMNIKRTHYDIVVNSRELISNTIEDMLKMQLHVEPLP